MSDPESGERRQRNLDPPRSFREHARQFLFGDAPVEWRCSVKWYLRALAVIYCIAFVSLRVQIDGLIGSDGIQPVKTYLAAIRAQAGALPGWRAPTLCWLSPSDGSLHAQCALGVVLSLLALAGIAQPISFFLLWLLYLSLTVASQEFLGYQWDNLLLEAGLLAVFLAPLRWLAWQAAPWRPSPLMLWLQRWLVFRLMFLSGLVKLLSGDRTWRSGTALLYHYWTQPIPAWTSWYAAKLPTWFEKLSVSGVFVAELAVPILMFGPRRLRVTAAASTIFLQVLILLTGNYGFFNLLAIALCIPLLDDAVLPGRRAQSPAGADAAPDPAPLAARGDGSPSAEGLAWPGPVLVLLAATVVVVSLMRGALQCGYVGPWPGFLSSVSEVVEPFRSINGYGLFASMTTERPELIIEGSDDGRDWKEYAFRWKAGDPHRPPEFCTPHLPRLDWQLWFAALDPAGNREMLEGLMGAILRGSKPVMGLMRNDPFAGHPPRFVRVRMYLYYFTSSAERKNTGDWWKRSDTGQISESFALH